MICYNGGPDTVLTYHKTWLGKYPASDQAQYLFQNTLLGLNRSGTTWLTTGFFAMKTGKTA